VVSVLVVEHEAACPVDRFGAWLDEAGVAVTTCRPYQGDAVPAAVEQDGLIVLGGHMGAEDDEVAPWLPAVRGLLADSVRSGTPALGICLGAQLLAVACGGSVAVGAPGIEAGVVDVHWRPEAAGDRLLGGLPDPFPAPSMHLDAVVDLPPGAAWLAETTQYPHQAFRVGDAAWGVQFHPEVSVGTFRAWGEHHRDEWAGWRIDGDDVVDQRVRRSAEVEAAGRTVATRFAVLLA
jgi:GMP synthase (glutamine-hydrolysing)